MCIYFVRNISLTVSLCYQWFLRNICLLLIGSALDRSKIQLSFLVSLLYAQVNVQRKALQNAKIHRFQLQERQYTTFQVKIRLF